MGEIEDLRAEVERLRANGLDWMKRYEAAVEHERAAEARLRKVEALLSAVDGLVSPEYVAMHVRAALDAAVVPAEDGMGDWFRRTQESLAMLEQERAALAESEAKYAEPAEAVRDES